MRRRFVLVLFVALSVAASGVASDQIHNTVKEKYRTVEVGGFTVEKGVELPPEFATALPQEIVAQLQESKVFAKVSAISDTTAATPASSAPVMRMTGIVTAFHEGSRKGRYFGGAFNPGANTQIYAYVRFTDAATNALITETEVVGTMAGGLFGGDSKKVVHEFAKSLVDTTKFIVLKPPLTATDQAPKVADNAERETVELSDSAYDAALARVNDLAAKGYRLVDFKTTSYQTANLTMAKTGDHAQYQYAFFKALLAGSVQKDLTKKSQEGFRYRPHTMIVLKNHVFAIAERNTSAPSARYEYKLHTTMLESSAEKNIREDQGQGFVLVDCRPTMDNQHMLLLEKKGQE